MVSEQIVLATDDLALVATLGFFVPAAIVVSLVAGAIWRDRRAGRREQDAAAPHEQL